MRFHFAKYQGAGNDFVLIDNRNAQLSATDPLRYARWCDRHFGIGADGLILINPPQQPNTDFYMAYYNADGRIGSMCGNGGRCAVAFAYHLGIVGQYARFGAADGWHEAHIDINTAQVSLRMSDVAGIDRYGDDYIVQTGSPQYVRFVVDIAAIDTYREGKAIRHLPEFAAAGINVNFVQRHADGSLLINTFERGVEDETLACGTGVVAASIAAHHQYGNLNTSLSVLTHITAKGGKLQTRFMPQPNISYTDVWLTGGAEWVFDGSIVD